MKKAVLIAAATFLVMVLLGACGVPSDRYDEMVAQRDAAQSQLQSTRGDLEKAGTDLDLAESGLEAANSEIERLKADLQSATAQLQSSKTAASEASVRVTQLQQSMAKAKALADILALCVDTYDSPSMTDAQLTALGLEFFMKIGGSGDPELQRLCDAWVDSGFADGPMYEMIAYIFETIPRLLDSSTSGARLL